MWFDTLQTAFPGLFVLSVSDLNSGVCLQAAVGLALFIFMGFVSLNTGSNHTDLFQCTRKSLGFASPSPEACLRWPKQGTLGTQKNPTLHVQAGACMSPPARQAQKHQLCPKTLQSSNPSKLLGTGFLLPLQAQAEQALPEIGKKKKNTGWREMGCLISALWGLGSSFFPLNYIFLCPNPIFLVFTLLY